MRGNLLRVLERTAVLEVSGDSSRSKGVTAGGVGEGGFLGAPLDHIKHVAARHRIDGQPVAPFEAAK